MSHAADKPAPHALTYLPLRGGLHLCAYTLDALRAEMLDSGQPIMVVLRRAVMLGAKQMRETRKTR